jgi:hypothetical protein
LRTNPDEVNQQDQIKLPEKEDETTKTIAKRMANQHNKSNSLAYPILNNTGGLSIKDAIPNERDSRSLNTSIRQSN